MPTATAECQIEEGSVGEASARRAFRHPQIDASPSALAVGTFRDLEPKKNAHEPHWGEEASGCAIVFARMAARSGQVAYIVMARSGQVPY